MNRPLQIPSPALLARYPEHLPYLLHHAPVDHYRAGGLDLVPLYTESVGSVTNLYFIQADAPKGPIKIGVAGKPVARLAQLQNANPSPLTLVTHVPGTATIEHEIHAYLTAHRRMGEWFDPATPVLEVVAEFFEIHLMIEDFARDGFEVTFPDLAEIMSESARAAA